MKRMFALALVVAACRSAPSAPPPPKSGSPEPTSGKSSKPPTSLPTLSVLLDDPTLAAVRALERNKEPAAAARTLHDARPATLDKAAACAWDYVEGRLWLAAGTNDAIAALERAEDAACPLATYARLRVAQALARAGRADEAIAKAQRVPDDIGARDEAKLVVAESLAAKNDRAGALPLWRAWLATNPHGSRWVDTTVRIANALLDGVDGPAEGRAREAFDHATKVIVEAPKLADAAGAVQARARAAVLLKIDPALTEQERARQAQAWLDGNEPQRAFEIASGVLAAKGAAACKAAITRANAAAKVKPPRVDAWADAVTACEKEDELVGALYSGAKARAGKDPKGALDWYAKVEKLFPSHRLADDARFRAALVIAGGNDEGHEDRAEEMLRSLPDAYPSGDMRAEAIFRVALAKMSRGQWQDAKPLLDRVMEIAPDDRFYATAGRALYFRGRAAAMTGDAEGARTRYRRVVESYPLGFYMLLAHARLAAEDAAGTKRLLEETIAKDKTGTFPSGPHDVFGSAAFVRAVRLLEVGEIDAARREMTASGALAESADPEVVWAVGALYNQAGIPEIGHAVMRGKLAEYASHYPEGRWRTAWEVAYPRAYEAFVTKACEKNALPRPVAWGIMREESNFWAEAKSPSNAYGLMQLIIPTAKWVSAGTGLGSDELSLKKPEVSIELGTRLLGQLRQRHGHPVLAIAAYNAGSGASDRWVKAPLSTDLDLFVDLIPYEETRNYVKRVLGTQTAYAYLYDNAVLNESLALPLGFSH